ncbi:MAG: response regulator [Sandaracinus sp.]|nr:response regulator [Sandaracinus sp.]MCB9613717.1 response regulator [Sandaracinus sp.]MCB9632036.1 response regulator [Sandaracinus sp.]
MNDRIAHLLLVEDSPTDRLVALEALRFIDFPHEVHVVTDGVEAMAFLRWEGRFGNAPRPDLVLLDLNLPRMDGREVLTEVKRDLCLRTIPVVVLTTSEDERDVRAAYEAHANGYVAKPLDVVSFAEKLAQVVRYWLDVVVPPMAVVDVPSRPPPVPGPRDESLAVLLVEDSETDALLAKDALHEAFAGVHVRHVRRLGEALLLLRERDFDVVLVDLGLPDAQGLETFDRISVASRDAALLVLSGLEDERFALATLRRGAQDYLMKSELSARSFARAVRYAVDRRTAQRQLRASQRLEALGQVAGGVTHDFNNILAVIQISATSLPQVSGEVAEVLDDIRIAADRGADLTRQLLTFTRRQVARLEPMVLHEVVENAMRMIGRVVERVRVEVEGKTTRWIEADRTMIEQVLMNLAINARDAMPDGGVLRVRVVDRPLTTEEARALHPDARPGNFLELSVSDEGTGIPADVLERIWEPFFTTKEGARGTGLGLATVYGIVRQHRGWVTVQSEVGRGTTFRLFFPVVRRHTPLEPATPRPSSQDTARPASLLVVDDEPGVRTLAARVLERAGHRVWVASDANEALATWERSGPFDVVITDVRMSGGMNGPALATELRRRAGKVRVILATGFSEDSLEVELASPLTHFLAKPFTAQELLDGVARLREEPLER